MSHTSHDLTRRELVTAGAVTAGAMLWPGRAEALRSPAPAVTGTVILFQGDSITDSGRNRDVAEPNVPGALGTGYPLLVAAAARAARNARATFVPLQLEFDDLSRRAGPKYWAADGVHPTPAGHAVIAERWRRAAHL